MQFLKLPEEEASSSSNTLSQGSGDREGGARGRPEAVSGGPAAVGGASGAEFQGFVTNAP